MPFGEIVVGPPGSGKTTYAYGKHQLFSALKRPIAVVNLDPANDNILYPCSISISSLITLSEVMETYKLGPNGAMLYCMEYLEANFDWLEEELNQLQSDKEKEMYVVFDFPGQVELWTNHPSVKRIVDLLTTKMGYRLASVHLCDAHNVTDVGNYVSALLLSLRTMLQLALPHINVLSKIDLLGQYGDLAFNLDFYTEVQDLSYLQNLLNTHSPRYAALNMAICSLIEDYSLVGFETLAVEDKDSMLHLSRVIDKATGAVYVPPSNAPAPEGTVNPPNASSSSSERPNMYSLFSSASGPMKDFYSNARDVQERWVDARDEYDAFERWQWRKEGEMVAAQKEKEAKKESTTESAKDGRGFEQKIRIRERL